MSQGSPSPRKTLTALEPLTFPMALSAHFSLRAAAREAKVSGMEVPMATNVMAVMKSDRPTTQPKMAARSETTAVSRPMQSSAIRKVGHPEPTDVGGMHAKRTCIGQI